MKLHNSYESSRTTLIYKVEFSIIKEQLLNNGVNSVLDYLHHVTMGSGVSISNTEVCKLVNCCIYIYTHTHNHTE
jgi:hypothetical protein